MKVTWKKGKYNTSKRIIQQKQCKKEKKRQIQLIAKTKATEAHLRKLAAAEKQK